MTQQRHMPGSTATGIAPTHLTRRSLLGIGGAGAAGLILASCSGGGGGGAGEDFQGDDLMEAPQLTEMVDAGELPPLEERLPTNPLVVENVEGPGQYGGTWRVLGKPGGSYTQLQRYVGHAYLLRWNPDYTELLPDVAESWEMNEEATEIRLTIREGLKWSDGEPFTAEDVAFAVNDVINHPEINPANPRTTSAVAESETELVLTAETPNGLWLRDLAGPSRDLVSTPRHYLEQFHKDYNDAVEDLVAEEGAEDWVNLFQIKGGLNDDFRNNAVDLPVISAWKVSQAPGAGGTEVTYSRNPYFYKVDPDGRQLPYIDEVHFALIDDEEVMLTAGANGEVDMQGQYFNTSANKPVLADSRESGDYRFFDMVPTTLSEAVLALNITSEDELKREAFQNRDFRIAISHALDRQEIIDVVYQRQGEPWQAAPRPESDLYDEEFAKQYTERDLDLAQQHFEAAGFGETDASGQRLWSDGSPMSFFLMVESSNATRPDVAQLIVGQLAEVGITVQVDAVDGTLFQERIEGNQHDAALASGDGGANDMYQDPRWYFPFHNGNSRFATPWAQWYNSGGANGQEPPAEAQEQMDLYDQLLATGDQEKQTELMGQIHAIAKEQFWAIGTVLPANRYGIVKNSMRNVPESMVDAYYYGTPGPTNPEQYFFQS